MTERNNEARLGEMPEERASSITETPLSFTAPTEIVDLPSGGKLYPEGHPLHGVESMEIKFMTAKEEDILTSRSLLKKGVAIDRLLESVIVSPKVSPEHLLVGDKNALIVAARITGYGSNYETSVICPACDERSRFEFDLEVSKTVKGGDSEDAVLTDRGTYKVTLPMSKWEVEVRLLTGKDEKAITEISEKKKKRNMPENSITEQFKMMIVSVQGEEDKHIIGQAIQAMPASDSRFLREVYGEISPGIDLTQDFTCRHCGTTAEMEVPFNTEFFWPRR